MSKFPFFINLPKTDIFIETGTGQADSSKEALKFYKKVYTIDIDNRNKFSNENFLFFNEDSRTALPEILKNIKERSTFWLDAHPNNHDVNTWPLLSEIDIICTHFIKDHNILIDDADIVINSGKMMFIIERLAKNNPKYRENLKMFTQIRALDTLVATTENVII